VIILFLSGCEKIDFDFLREETDKVEEIKDFDRNQTQPHVDGEAVGADEVQVFKHNQTELEVLKNLAISGDMDMQYTLGYKYLKGIDLILNYKEAAKWFILAGRQGHAGAQFKLGSLYEHGIGVEKNVDSSLEWFTKSAEGQNVYAQNQLGWIYANGHGVEEDYSLAVRWFRQASERNYFVAQANLSTMYRDGKGVDQDYGLAKTWWVLAMEADTKNQFKNETFYQFQMNR
jgi:hypothetical protein